MSRFHSMIDETLSLPAMGALDRIVMQSCGNTEKFDINEIIYMTQRLFPNGRIRNCLGNDKLTVHTPVTGIAHHTHLLPQRMRRQTWSGPQDNHHQHYHHDEQRLVSILPVKK